MHKKKKEDAKRKGASIFGKGAKDRRLESNQLRSTGALIEGTAVIYLLPFKYKLGRASTNFYVVLAIQLSSGSTMIVRHERF
jgi:hypothetical protein